jgi:hypothetical protein
MVAVAGRRAEMEEKKKKEDEMQRKKLEIWGENVSSGSDLTDLRACAPPNLNAHPPTSPLLRKCSH